MILSNNKEILIDWRTLFYHNLIEKGVSMLHDIIDASSSFLHLNSSNNIMELSVIFLIISK